MNHWKGHIAMVLWLLAALAAQGQPEATLALREAGGRLELSFRLGSVSVVPDGGEYCAVEAPGMTLAGAVPGCPALPAMSRVVLLPRGSVLTYGGEWKADAGTREMATRTQRLRPATGARAKEARQPAYHPDKEIYESDQWYRGGAPVEVEHVGTLGEQEVYRLTVRPMEYNPLRQSLRYSPAIDATIGLKTPATPVPVSSRYLVVAPAGYEEGLRPFLRWKRQQGFEVDALYLATHQRDSVRAAIADVWSRRGQVPGWVLLVGDAAQIQSFIGTTHPSETDNHTTDLYYVEHTGDYLPDARLGRWPVNDTAELGRVVRKTLRYEQALDLDSAALGRMLLVAGHETSEPAPVTTDGQVNYVSREVKRQRPWMDTTVFRNGESAGRRDGILAAIGGGVGVLNYTAHCTTAGWSNPSVSYTSIDTLDEGVPTFYINNCCKSNTFSGTGFGEQLLRKERGGAVAVIGATNSTLWDEDFYWSVGPKYPFTLQPAYDSLLQGAFDRLLAGPLDAGGMVQAGNLAVTAFGSPYDKFYWEIYCLLGDPSLVPWFGLPQPLALRATETPRDGDGHLALEGTPGATVTAMQHDTVAGRGTVAANGTLHLALTRTLDTTPLLLTASGPGLRPRMAILPVAHAAARAATLRQVSIDDSLVRFRIENIGTQPLHGLEAALVQQAADTAQGAVVQPQILTVDTLQAGQWVAVQLPVALLRLGESPWWQAALTLRDSVGETLCSVALRQWLPLVFPTVGFRLLDTDGDESHRLLPNREYLLETTLEGAEPAALHLTTSALPGGEVLADTTLESATLSPFHLPISTSHLTAFTHLRLTADITYLGRTEHTEHYLVAGERTESFEEGYGSHPWQSPTLHPWVVDSTVSFTGRYSARSGQIGDRQESDLVLEVLLPQPDTLLYRVRTSCETRYDKFQFFIDGQRVGNEAWGESDWQQRRVVVDAGRHTLLWRYVKDAREAHGSDCVWIDDLRLPLALWDSTWGWHGDSIPLSLPHPAHAAPAVYPNPTTGPVTVEGHGTLRLYDLYGRELYSTSVRQRSTIDLGFLPDGLYLILCTGEDGVHRQKLILKH